MHPDRNCLTESELGAYIEKTLDSKKAGEVERKLADCSGCRRELRLASSLLHAPLEEAPLSVVERARAAYPADKSIFDVIAALVKDSVRLLHSSAGFDLQPAPGLPGLRGGRMVAPDMVVLNKSFDEFDAELSIEKLHGGACSIRVHAVEQGSKASAEGLMVSLYSDDRELASGKTEHGRLVFEDVSPGRYLVRFFKRRKSIAEIAIKIIA